MMMMKLSSLLMVSILHFLFTSSSVKGFRPFPSSFLLQHTKQYSRTIPIRTTHTQPASSTSLYLFDRFIRVVTSNVNSLLKGLEDPEKVLEQAVSDMQNDLVRIRQSYADVYSTQKRMERQKEAAQSTANEWYRRAQLAMSKGEEELAREALLQKQQQMELVKSVDKQLQVQAAAAEKLYTSIQTLEKKISEAKRQKESFIARAKTAKTSIEVNNLLQSITGSVSGSNSMEAFERMKDKVESLEAQADMAAQIIPGTSAASQSLEDKFRALEGNKEVEEELNQLRGMKTPKLLPLPATIEDEFQQMKSDVFYNRKKLQ
eukprot:gene7303-7879_t